MQAAARAAHARCCCALPYQVTHPLKAASQRPQRIHVGNLLRRICELDIQLIRKVGSILFEGLTTPRRTAPFAVIQFNGDVLLRNTVQHGCRLTRVVPPDGRSRWQSRVSTQSQPGEPPQPLTSNEVQISCPCLCTRPSYTQSRCVMSQ